MFQIRPLRAACLLLLGTVGSAYAAAPSQVPPSDAQGLSIDLNFRPGDSRIGNFQMSVDMPSTGPSAMSIGLCRNQSTGATDFSVYARKDANGENQMLLNMQISR
jgi:hypothetical protein